MKIGDKVVYNKPNSPLDGKEGVLLTAHMGYGGVQFDEEVPEGHDCNGKGTSGHCLYVPLSQLSVVAPFKIGQEVAIYIGDYIGKTGIVTQILDDSDPLMFEIECDDIGTIRYTQDYIMDASQFVAPLYQIGDRVDIHCENLSTQDINKIDMTQFAKVGAIIPSLHGPISYQYMVNTMGYDSTTVKVNESDLSASDKMEWMYGLQDYMKHTTDWNREGILESALFSQMPRDLLGIYIALLCENKPYKDIDYETSYHLFYACREGGDWNIELSAILDNELYILPYSSEEDKLRATEMLNSSRLEIEWLTDRIARTKNHLNTYIFLYDINDISTVIENVLFLAPNKESKLYQALSDHDFRYAWSIIDEINKRYIEEYERNKRNEEIAHAIKTLGEFERKTLNRDIEDLQDKIDRTNQALRDYYKNLHQKRLQAMGLSDSSDEMECFKMTIEELGDNLKSLEVNDSGNLTIHVVTDLMFFDEDLYNAGVREAYHGSYPDKVLDLLDDIVYKKVTLVVEESVTVFSNGTIQCRQKASDRDDIDLVIKTGYPNPHHVYYNCWGQNGNFISKAKIEQHYTTCLRQILSAMQGLNVTDGAVMEKMLNDFNRHYNKQKYKAICFNNPCIRDNATGELFTISEYLHRNDGKEEEK